MSGPVHVGECEPIEFKRQEGRQPLVMAPWPRFTVLTDVFFSTIELRNMKRRADGMAIQVRLHADNGDAKYRRVGRDDAAKQSVWELVESEYAAPRQPGPAGVE